MCVCMCVRVYACACTHVWGVPPLNPTPTLPPPRGVPPQISKNAIRLERIEIFRFRLKIWNLWRISHPWVGVFLVGGWVDGWVSGSKHVEIIKILIKLDLIEIILFCLKIYDLWTHYHLWIGVWVGGWVDGWVSGSVHVKSLKIE